MATTTQAPTSTGTGARASRRWSRLVRRIGLWGFRLAFLAAVGLNIWLFLRDRGGVESLKNLRTLVDQRRYAEAVEGIRDRLRRSPHDDEARMLLARSLAGDRRMLECAEELRRVPFWSPRKPEARYLEGQALLEVGRAREAEAVLRICVENDPLHPTPDDLLRAATDQLIELYASESRWQDAQEVVWKIYDRANREDRAAALVMLLRTEIERIDPASTIERLRRYAQTDPSDFEARRALARAEQAVGREAEATATIEQCLKERPADLKVWRDWLTILQDRGDAPGLAAAVRQLPADHPDEYDPAVWEAIGRVREAEGDVQAAADAYRKAVQGRPRDEDFHYRLALVEARLGNREQAHEHLERSKELRKSRTELVDAVIAYREALAVAPATDPKVMAEAAKVADLCRVIGLDRTAKALDSTHELRRPASDASG